MFRYHFLTRGLKFSLVQILDDCVRSAFTLPSKTQNKPNPTQPKPELNPNVRFDLWLSARFALCEAFFAFPTL